MKSYLEGTDILGAAWGTPAVIDDPDWGKPVVVAGRGGPRGGGPRGGGGPRPSLPASRPVAPWRGIPGQWRPELDWDVVDVDDVELLRCVEFDAKGNCLKYVPADLVDVNGDVIGFVDIQQSQRKMNELKAVTVGIAQPLLRGGMDAIDGAIRTSKAKGLPNAKQLDNVRWKLVWHRDNLAKFADRNAPYVDANDLKKWVMQAFIEANATEEGALYLEQIWTAMWVEIETELAKMPQWLRDQTSKVVENVTGLPVWGWALIGVGVVAAAAGAVYAILNSRAGAVVAGHVARRYIP
jgi:hypothetical protein